MKDRGGLDKVIDRTKSRMRLLIGKEEEKE